MNSTCRVAHIRLGPAGTGAGVTDGRSTPELRAAQQPAEVTLPSQELRSGAVLFEEDICFGYTRTASRLIRPRRYQESLSERVNF